MAKNGLDKWFAQKWVDIGSKKKDGSFSKCGRSKQKKDAKRKYPKCDPDRDWETPLTKDG